MRPERNHYRVTLGIFILAGLLLMGGLFIPQPASAQVDLLKVSGKYGLKAIPENNFQNTAQRTPQALG